MTDAGARTPRTMVRQALLAPLAAAVLTSAAAGQGAAGTAPPPARRAVYLDQAGVVRWRDDRSEVTLFGANYVVTTASDYRAAGYLQADRKQMIEEDMAQFAR
ncbi:MAG: hypothetical protein AB7Q69_09250, partial [Gemmatimonadales bacterium]